MNNVKSPNLRLDARKSFYDVSNKTTEVKGAFLSKISSAKELLEYLKQ